MSALEVLEELKGLSNQERLAVIETASRLIREDLVNPQMDERRRQAIPMKDIYEERPDLFDREFLALCAKEADPSITLESVRAALAKIPGSMADEISAERDER